MKIFASERDLGSGLTNIKFFLNFVVHENYRRLNICLLKLNIFTKKLHRHAKRMILS